MDDTAFGLFKDDEALRDLDNMEVVEKADGLHMTRRCETCTNEVGIVLTWPELFAISMGVMPQEVWQGFPTPWRYHAKIRRLYPEIMCRSCGDRGTRSLVMFGMTPHDARRHVMSAESSGTVDPQQAQAILRAKPTIQQISQTRRR